MLFQEICLKLSGFSKTCLDYAGTFVALIMNSYGACHMTLSWMSFANGATSLSWIQGFGVQWSRLKSLSSFGGYFVAGSLQMISFSGRASLWFQDAFAVAVLVKRTDLSLGSNFSRKKGTMSEGVNPITCTTLTN